MCGFAGVHLSDCSAPIDAAGLRTMVATLRHRGPDGEGIHLEPALGLGFVRLAIIDPAGGHQPFASSDGRRWLVFNGEIYNFRELRAQLEAAGRRFVTRSDTEVVLQALEEWGEGAIERFNGIFAFARWDRDSRELLLVRDRSGIKPLYLRFEGSDLWFASEAKALLSRSQFREGIDIVGYMGGDEVDPMLEKTPFIGIRQLGAGCLLRIRDGAVSVRRYWSYAPSIESDWDGDEQSLIEEAHDRLETAVTLQLVSDVPIAASLSGGIDSAAVVAAMVRAGRSDVETYTVEFAGDATGDVRHSKMTADALGVAYNGVPCIFDENTSALIPRVAWYAEGEFDLGFVARYRLAAAVRDAGAKVLLTGQGIDEILTGYYASYQHFRRISLVRRMQYSLLPSYRGWPPFGSEAIDELGARYEYDPLDEGSHALWPSLAAEKLRADHHRLSSGMLRFEDRMGMACGVEVRVPLLDHELIQFFASFPEPARATLFSAKRVLREAMRPYLPVAIVERPKLGFNASAAPLTALVANHPADLGELISDETVRRLGYFDPEICAAIRSRRDYVLLDHVFVVHLLHRLFIERFDPQQFASREVDSAVLDSASSEPIVHSSAQSDRLGVERA